MTDYRFEYIKNQMIDELLVEQQKSKILMEQQKSNDEKIRQLKEDIAINKEKLQKLEELQRTKSPVEEAFKRVYDVYPMTNITDTCWDGSTWTTFLKGYKSAQEDYKVGEYQPTPKEPEDNEWKTVALGFGENLSAIGPDGYYDFTPVEWYDWVVDIYENTANEYLKLLEKERAKAKAQKHEKELVRKSKKWCEEHPDESVEDYLTPQGPQGPVGPGPGPKGVIVGYEPTPQTPEQIEKSLREAFQKVQQTEEWKETQRKIDAPKESWMNKPVEELVAMLEKNPPDCLKFVMGKSLEDRIYKWWETCFSRHPEWSMEECVEDLLDIITLFLPAEQSHEGTQNIDTVVAVEAHNELLQKIKSKLRNKDTP